MVMPSKPEIAEAARLAFDGTVTGNAAKATVAGGATLMIGGFTASELAMIVGAIVAIGGFIVQVFSQMHAKKARDRDSVRREEIHAMRMQIMRNSDNAAQAAELATTVEEANKAHHQARNAEKNWVKHEARQLQRRREDKFMSSCDDTDMGSLD